MLLDIIHLRKINRTAFLDKDRMMDNVHQHNICTMYHRHKLLHLIFNETYLRQCQCGLVTLYGHVFPDNIKHARRKSLNKWHCIDVCVGVAMNDKGICLLILNWAKKRNRLNWLKYRKIAVKKSPTCTKPKGSAPCSQGPDNFMAFGTIS
jgi:hypothetical protein